MSDIENAVKPLVPGVYALFPLKSQDDDRNLALKAIAGVKDLYSEPQLSLKKLDGFMETSKPLSLPQLFDPRHAKPIIDEKGREVLCQIWVNPNAKNDPRFMTILYSPKSKDSSGRTMYKPEKIIRGPWADTLMVGGMSCCGSAAQTYWTQVKDGGHTIEGKSRVPLGGLVHDEHANWLQGKLQVAVNGQGLVAMFSLAKDIMAAQRPDDPNLKISVDERQAYRTHFERAPTI